MNLERFWLKCQAFKYILNGNVLPSFSQAGEDIILQYLFQKIKIKSPTYLDIGTNHPIIGNNTYLLYLRGSKGVCIEPDPELCKQIKRKRPNSKLLQVGIGLSDQQHAPFYIFPQPYTGWNTFSKDEASKKETESGIKVKRTISIPLMSINEIIQQNFSLPPDFLSIDIEGLDLPVLKTLDFEKYAPAVICAETISFSMSGYGEKQNDLVSFLKSQNYIVYADTHINTIFCKKNLLGE